MLTKPKADIALLSIALLAIFLLLAFIAADLFQAYPYSMDENSMLFQARTFAHGRLFLEAEPFSTPLTDMWIQNENHRIFSKYPPGTAFALALGVLVGVPELINPLLSTGTALLVFLTIRHLFSLKIAWLMLGILATSPYFLPYGASFFSHPLSLFLTSLGFYIATRYQQAPSHMRCVAMGSCIGALFLVRQLDAAVLGVALGTPLLFQQLHSRQVKRIILFTLPALVGIATLLSYNYLLTGRLGISTFSVWSGDFPVQARDAKGTWDNIAKVFSAYLTSWTRNTFPLFNTEFLPLVGIGTFALFLFGCLYPMPSMKSSSLIFIALIGLLYTVHPSKGYPLYGSRYWYCTFGVFLLVAANFIGPLMRIIPKGTFYLSYILLLGVQIAVLSDQLSKSARRFDLFSAVREDIERTCQEKSIVVFKRPSTLAVDGILFFQWWDLHRNPRPLGSRLYVKRPEDVQILAPHFPDYTVCDYNFRDGKLSTELPGFPSA